MHTKNEKVGVDAFGRVLTKRKKELRHYSLAKKSKLIKK